MLVRRLGVIVTCVGLGLLGWGVVTWQWGDPVTGLYTSWEQRQLAAEYERLAESHHQPVTSPGVPTAAPRREVRRAARRLRVGAEDGQPIGRLVVEDLDLDMVVVNGTDSASLRKGPGRDSRTFMPGEGELVYIAGHRTTFGAPFEHIERLERGDRVELEMPYGRFVYTVTRSVIVPADDIGRLRSRGREEIALQACHPRFSAKERYIVYALPIRGGPAAVGP